MRVIKAGQQIVADYSKQSTPSGTKVFARRGAQMDTTYQIGSTEMKTPIAKLGMKLCTFCSEKGRYVEHPRQSEWEKGARDRFFCEVHFRSIFGSVKKLAGIKYHRINTRAANVCDCAYVPSTTRIAQ